MAKLRISAKHKPKLEPVAQYDGATTQRAANGWQAPAGGPNTLHAGALATLRNRSRGAHRNNPWISHATNVAVSDEIGAGITPRSKAKDNAFRMEANDLWADWTLDADAEGVLDFYGLQALISRARRSSGEVFIRIRQRRPEDGLAAPLQVQVLESDYCPLTLHRTEKNGNRTISGIEFDRVGRRAAYWMHRSHPAERVSVNFDANTLVRVPAESVLHHYIPQRPGQIRGEPDCVQSLLRSHTFDSYDQAELTRKENRAQFTGVIKRPAATDGDWSYDPFTGDPLQYDDAEVPVLDLQPGSFPSLLAGEEIQLFGSDDAGTGYADYMRQQLMAIAAGLDVPYEVMTGDWSKVNDRIARVILQQYRRMLGQIQDHFVIHQVCRPIWRAFIDAAVLSGALSAPGYERNRRAFQRCEWRPHTHAYIHPVQDVQSKLAAIAGGIESRAAVVAERGWDVEAVDQQNAEDKTRAAALGLSYTGTPDDPETESDSGDKNDE